MQGRQQRIEDGGRGERLAERGVECLGFAAGVRLQGAQAEALQLRERVDLEEQGGEAAVFREFQGGHFGQHGAE